MALVIWLIASCLSALLYRLGGIGKPWNTRFRDAGCPLVALGLWWYIDGFSLSQWWAYLLVFGLSWGALSTYWDWITGKDNFYLHGFFCGLATFPLFWCGVHWWAILARAIVCAVGIGLWSKWIGNDTTEESGRGFIFTGTIPLLLI